MKKEAPKLTLASSTPISDGGKGKEVHISTSPIRYKGLTCPRCFEAADGMTQISGYERPPVLKPGMYVICCYCIEINIVTPMLTLRKATAFERREAMRNEDFRLYVRAAAGAREMRGERKI
jgi:hypothetical protein